ncbi:MAG: hypothetical protein COA49_01290 [Bacteroidetes bacterium]|nr:MAG: hypothetical protein COA49_01290 [Bacteroidota bacterium]
MKNRRSSHKSLISLTCILSLYLFAPFSNTLLAQNSTTYSLKSHAITFKSDRATITLDPALTLLWLSGEGYSGFNNTRGAKFQAEIDRNFTAGGQLLERQSTLSPFLSNFSRASGRLPGWGRFKDISQDNDEGDPLIVDVAKATGFIAWEGSINTIKGIHFRLSNEAFNFGWGRSPLLLNKDDAPYPSLNLGWKDTKYHFDFHAVKWIGETRGPIGSTTESLFTQSRAIFISGGYKTKSWGIASLIGSVRESDSTKSLSTFSMSGFSRVRKFSGTWEIVTSSSSFSTDGISLQLGGKYSLKKISTGINIISTKKDLYGLENEAHWSNAGLPLGIITGGDTKMSSIYFDFKTPTTTKWIFKVELGSLISKDYDYDFKWVRSSFSRVISKSWDMFGTISMDYTLKSLNTTQNPTGHIISVGIIHGITNL